MKILGGELKGRNFYMPAGIRPTQDTIRQRIFDILGHDMSGKMVLDVFAGSGSVAWEAISRGAKFVTLIEREGKHVKVIDENAEILGIEAYEVLRKDGFSGMKELFRQKRQFELIYVDPPYDRGSAKKALKTLGAYDILSPHSTIIIQHDKAEVLAEEEGSLRRTCVKRQGHTWLSFYEQDKSRSRA